MCAARIAIRLPASFMKPPVSGLLRRLSEERAQERAQVAAAALRARRALLALADGQGHRDLALALVAIELIERHGPTPPPPTQPASPPLHPHPFTPPLLPHSL